jgi:hypothetical protein
MLWEVVRSLLWWLIQLPGRVKHWLETAPGRFVRWWKREPYERWGYIWWGLSGVVIAVPELWAVVGGDDVLWPTISGTIGNLEVFHQWVALIVVAVLVWAAFHALSVTRERRRAADADSAESRTADGRRLVAGDRFTVATQTNELEHPLVYLLFAVGAVALPSVLFRELYHGDDHRYVFGEVMYASIAFWWMIVPGWLAYKHGQLVPFPTLFRTLKDLEGRAPRFTIVLAAGLAILMVHLILYPWPATIPDTNRLHRNYECHPVQPATKPLSEKQKEECRRLDEAELRPSAGAP